MKFLLGFAITLTVFLQVLLAQPVSNQPDNAKENAAYAYIFREAKLVADMIEPVIKRALPHIPKGPKYELYRHDLNNILKLKRDYKDSEFKEDCGEKAIKLFKAGFIPVYVTVLPTNPIAQEVNKILNEYGMQKVKDYLEEVRKNAATYGMYYQDEKNLNKYIIEHCKPSQSN